MKTVVMLKLLCRIITQKCMWVFTKVSAHGFTLTCKETLELSNILFFLLHVSTNMKPVSNRSSVKSLQESKH